MQPPKGSLLEVDWQVFRFSSSPLECDPAQTLATGCLGCVTTLAEWRGECFLLSRFLLKLVYRQPSKGREQCMLFLTEGFPHPLRTPARERSRCLQLFQLKVLQEKVFSSCLSISCLFSFVFLRELVGVCHSLKHCLATQTHRIE